MNGNMGLGDGGETHDVVNMIKKYEPCRNLPILWKIMERPGLRGRVPRGLKAILDAYLKNEDKNKEFRG
jgi:hypothetical protein